MLSVRPRQGKVALVTGGGSGHKPLFGGMIGPGLADAVACGNVFASPNPGIVYEAVRAVDSGAGALLLVLNYAGDNLNFEMAQEILQEEGHQVALVHLWDDCSIFPRQRQADRRGIAGSLFVLRVAGAACDAGLPLEEVRRIAQKAADRTATAGFATAPGYIPGVEKPAFTLGEDEMEYGVGIHGESGARRARMQPADSLVDDLYAMVAGDLALERGDRVCALINGLGATPGMELAIAYRRLALRLTADGISIYSGDCNTYCTCMEMAGLSLSLMKLDAELEDYFRRPCSSAYYTKEAVQG